MNVKTKRGIAAFGLAIGTSPSLFPVAETAVSVEAATVHEQLTHVIRTHLKGKIALKKLVTLEPNLNGSLPSSNAWQDPNMTPQVRRQLAKNAIYVDNALLPVVKKHELKVVKPINNSPDSPDYIGGTFIVTKNAKCGSQFFVNTATGNISVTVYGNLDRLRNGNEYGQDAYNGELSHAEGAQGLGYNFHKPQDAAAFVVRTNAQVCHIPQHKS